MSTHDSDTTQDPALRWVNIVADGGERLLKLQAQQVAQAMSGKVGTVELPVTLGDAISAMWRLPAFYGALFEEAAENVRQSFHIMSGVQNELIDLACDSLASQAPALAETLASGNALFADRRHRSVVISFPDRRTLRAMRAQGGSRGGA